MNIKDHMEASLEEFNTHVQNALHQLDGDILRALRDEFIMEHPSENEDQRQGRRHAVRGMAMRLGLYEELAKHHDI